MHKTRHICHESLRMCFVIVVNAPWFTSFHVAAAPVVPLTNSINQSSEVPITLCISRFTSFFFFLHPVVSHAEWQKTRSTSTDKRLCSNERKRKKINSLQKNETRMSRCLKILLMCKWWNISTLLFPTTENNSRNINNL